MNALAQYDSPPSSSPRLFFGLVAGSIATMALMLGLVFSSARPASSSGASLASSSPVTAAP